MGFGREGEWPGGHQDWRRAWYSRRPATDSASSWTSPMAAMDPVEAFSLTGNDAIGPLAAEVKDRLQRVLAAVERR